MERRDQRANPAVGNNNNRRARNGALVINEPANIVGDNANVPNDAIPVEDVNRNNDGGNVAYQRDPDQLFPAANISRIMRRILPAHAKISEDCKEMVQTCASEFIGFITAEANERSQRDYRKTVSAEDILFAMHRLGFDDYINPLTLYLNRYRQSEAARTIVHGDPSVRRTTDFSRVAQSAPAPPPPLPPPALPPQHLQPAFMPNINPAAPVYENYYWPIVQDQRGLYGQVPTNTFQNYDSGASSSTHGPGESSSNYSLAPYHPFSKGFDSAN